MTLPIILGTVTFLVVGGFAWVVVRVGSKPIPKIQTCTRPAPHVCTVNGPCNGWPR